MHKEERREMKPQPSIYQSTQHDGQKLSRPVRKTTTSRLEPRCRDVHCTYTEQRAPNRCERERAFHRIFGHGLQDCSVATKPSAACSACNSCKGIGSAVTTSQGRLLQARTFLLRSIDTFHFAPLAPFPLAATPVDGSLSPTALRTSLLKIKQKLFSVA